MIKAKKKFGAAAVGGRRGADLELDIDVDLGELEAQVASDMDDLSEDDRRVLREVEAEMSGVASTPDTERPARPPPEALDNDDDGDAPTHRPPPSASMPDLQIPKTGPLPNMEPRQHNQASALGQTRPVIRKADGKRLVRHAGTTANGHKTGPITGPITGPVSTDTAKMMPNVAAAPATSPPPASVSKIAAAPPAAGMRPVSPESSSMRAAPDHSATFRSPTSTAMRAAAPQSSSMRAAVPQGVPQSAGASQGGGGGGAPQSTSMRAAPSHSSQMRASMPVTSTSAMAPLPSPGPRSPGPGAVTGDRAPPASSAKSAGLGQTKPSIGVPASTRGRGPSSTNSKPPPPLPSSISTRGRMPSLSEIADAGKTPPSDKEPKK
jgi:hypothetical protein